jgi:hypothetical protein
MEPHARHLFIFNCHVLAVMQGHARGTFWLYVVLLFDLSLRMTDRYAPMYFELYIQHVKRVDMMVDGVRINGHVNRMQVIPFRMHVLYVLYFYTLKAS